VNPLPLDIRNIALPGGLVGFPYLTMVRTRGGALPFNFTTNGALPDGLGPIVFFDGRISGGPTSAGASAFEVGVSDGCAANATRPFSITINQPGVGRNDSIATATPLGNASFIASISPSGPSNTVFSPDQDYYVITTGAATSVGVVISANSIGSRLDSVVEFVDAGGTRLNLCVPPDYNSPCMNDDSNPGANLDSELWIRVANATTFYVRVVDWRGDGRPDFSYHISIVGVL
jgi:hypothetical protein